MKEVILERKLTDIVNVVKFLDISYSKNMGIWDNLNNKTYLQIFMLSSFMFGLCYFILGA